MLSNFILGSFSLIYCTKKELSYEWLIKMTYGEILINKEWVPCHYWLSFICPSYISPVTKLNAAKPTLNPLLQTRTITYSCYSFQLCYIDHYIDLYIFEELHYTFLLTDDAYMLLDIIGKLWFFQLKVFSIFLFNESIKFELLVRTCILVLDKPFLLELRFLNQYPS